MRPIKRVILTGGTGAIGMALIKKCIENNIAVLIIANPNSERNSRLYQWLEHDSDLIEIVECDMTSYNSLCFNKTYDAWFHLAWMGASGKGRDDMHLQNKNVSCMLDAVDAAKKAGCLVFVGAGSQAEYGPYDRKIKETDATNPQMGYGIAKLCAGQMGRMMTKETDMDFVWTRIFSVYGPYDGPNTMISSGISALLAGKTASFTMGEQQWDYLYSEDAAHMLLMLAQKGAGGNVYNIGSGMTRTLAEYIEVFAKEIGKKEFVSLGAIPYGSNTLMHLAADLSKYCQEIENIQLTPFEEGIRNTIQWMKEEYERPEVEGR
ncbi:MAG: NAD(P)-dependent oxidoreductase [Eubacteriales bacterium]|nr:NAD(P)-dependent oxidoreductase [Eubacteriales bacterium]